MEDSNKYMDERLREAFDDAGKLSVNTNFTSNVMAGIEQELAVVPAYQPVMGKKHWIFAGSFVAAIIMLVLISLPGEAESRFTFSVPDMGQVSGVFSDIFSSTAMLYLAAFLMLTFVNILIFRAMEHRMPQSA